MSKNVKIQEILSKKRLKNSKILSKKYGCFWVILPKKLTKKRGWKKGDTLIFLEPEELANIGNGDLILRQKQKVQLTEEK